MGIGSPKVCVMHLLGLLTVAAYVGTLDSQACGVISWFLSA